MKAYARGPVPVLAIIGVLVLLLVTLAVLQYRWLGQLSAAERDRLRAGLEHAAARFCDDVDRELGRALVTFAPLLRQSQTSPGERLVERIARWRDEAPYPGLVKEVAVVSGGRNAPIAVTCGEIATGLERPCSWPEAFAPVEAAVLAGQPVPPFPESVPGFVLTGTRLGGRRGWQREGGEAPRQGGTLAVLVTLDLDYVTTEVLPRLAALYFGGAPGQEYSVEVVARTPGAPVMYHFGPAGVGLAAVGGDVSRPFFGLRPFPGMGLGGQARGWREHREAWAELLTPPAADRPAAADAGPSRIGGGDRWLLRVSHPAGSLERAVGQARRRSLTIGLSVLALLGLSSILAVVASQRAQRLARQQLDFVAAVSHELRTPLTAIHSAGQNLADGVVTEPDQVKRYGTLIASEGRRLGELVSRVLVFAGIRSGQPAYRPRPVDIAALAGEVMHDSEWLLGERGFVVETEIAPDIPPVLADPAALRQVLVNLVDNAVKFSGKERWLRVRVSRVPTQGRQEVSVEVSDRGRGIRRAELGKVFTPFFRGAETGGVPGSGLGLAVVKHIVEALDGRITVSSEPGAGTAFDVRLPVAPKGAPVAASEP